MLTPTSDTTAAERVRRRRRLWRGIVLIVAAMVLIGIGDLIMTWWRFAPAIEELASARPGPTSYMRLQVRHGLPASAPTWTPLEQVSSLAACAVEAAEDPAHMTRPGVDWARQRVILARVLRGDASSGGSGLQQQLARNLFLSPARTPRRKLRELLLATEVSRTLSPQRQLELYLNVAEWGPGIWGIADGARRHMGRVPSALRPSEAVLLAAMLPAPSRGVEFAAGRSRANQRERIVRTLWDYGLIDTETASQTLARLERIASLMATDHTLAEAQAQVNVEMGVERVFEGSVAGWYSCDRSSRHLP